MREVTVDKNQLREKLVQTRQQHRAIFEEAPGGFQGKLFGCCKSKRRGHCAG